MSGKKLVIYYSFEGSTAMVGKTIAESVGADILELKPVDEIKTHGFMKFVWGGKQAVMKKKPELKPYDLDLSEYDLIFLGTPVWAGNMTPPMRSFLNNEEIKGKNIALFCCHQGGQGKTLRTMEEVLAKNNNVISGKDFVNPEKNKEECVNKVKKWAAEVVVKL